MKVINNEFNIWEEKYRPHVIDDIILPEEYKEQFKEFTKQEMLPNMLFVSSIPGCSVEGNNVEIIFEGKTKKELLKKYPLLQKDYIFNCLTENVSKDLYIVNEIALEKIEKNWKKFKHCIRENLRNEHKHNSKYLSLTYWLNFKDVEYSCKKLKQLKKRSKYFEKNHIELNFKPDNNGKLALLKIRKQLIDLNPDKKLTDLEFFKIQTQFNKKWWIFRGYSESEAEQKIKNIQSKNSKKWHRKHKENP